MALPYPPEPLRLGRFEIRRWAEDDLDAVREASGDPDIPRGTTVPVPFTVEAGLAFIRRQWSRADEGVGVSQAIVDTGRDRAVGLIIVSLRPQAHVGGLGYWVVPSARGQGAATTAVSLVTPWAFHALGLRRVEAWVEPDNHASQRVLARAGFDEEGRLRNFLTTTAGTTDALVFSAVPPD
jgi:ribosomal-protein-alanine N-acetyltransferase